MELLRIHLSDGDRPTLQIDGEIDMSTAAALRAALEQAIAADPDVIVDMAGVTFCDVTGLRVVLQVAASLNGAGPLRLLNAERIKWLLDLVGLGGLSSIKICDEVTLDR